MAELKFKQITVGQWDGTSGMTYSIIALGEDGCVYKFTKDGWVALPGITKSRTLKPRAVDHDVVDYDFDDEMPF